MTRLNLPLPVPPFPVTSASKIEGRVVRLMNAQGNGRFDFRSHSVAALELDFEGIAANRHRGHTRKADARVPYLKRGTQMRNSRHLSLVSVEDCTELARRLDLDLFDPAWLGANLVVAGIPHFSYIPRGTKLLCEGGAVLNIEDQNAPCSRSAEAIAQANPGRDDIERTFAKIAKGLRGIVATVEYPALLRIEVSLTLRLPEQWIYG